MKLGIRLKILIPVILMNIIIGTVLSAMVMGQFQKQCIATGAQGALSIVTLAKARIAGNTMKNIAIDGADSSSYMIVYDQIVGIVDSVGVNRVYTVGYDANGELCYLIDIPGDGEQAIATGTSVDEFVSLSARVAMSNDIPFAYKSIRKVGEKQIIVGVAPVSTKSGEVVGSVFIEYDATSLQNAVNNTRNSVILLAVIIVVACSVLMLFILQRILTGVQKVNQKIKDIVETDGDLTQKVEVKSGDEIEEIANNINALLDYIRTVIQNISDNTDTLHTYSELSKDNAADANNKMKNISDNMLQMSASMEETMASVNEVDDAMGRMKRYVEDMEKSVEQGARLASRVEDKAARLVNQTAEKTKTVREKAAEIESSLKETLEKSRNVEHIRELTEKILEIASQTELLSLNANIEAARAGEAGRGFAVVASEISKLSKDSADSAQAIQSISDVVLSTVSVLAQQAELMLNFMNEETIAGYGQLIDTGNQYSEDAKNFYQMMNECLTQAQRLAAELTIIHESTNGIMSAVSDSNENIAQVTEHVGQLSEELSENENQAKMNLSATDNLETEVRKFII